MTAPERDDLIAGVTAWVHALARQYGKFYRLPADDLAQSVFAELLRQADTFDPTRGNAATWAKWITRRTVQSMRAAERRATPPGRTRRVEPEDRPGEEYGSVIPDPAADLILAETVERVRVGLTRLRPRDAEAVTRVYGIGCEAETRGRVAAAMGVSQSRINQRVARGLAGLAAPVRITSVA